MSGEDGTPRWRVGQLVTHDGSHRIGEVIAYDRGLPRVRWSGHTWSGLYWPTDLRPAPFPDPAVDPRDVEQRLTVGESSD